MSRIAFGYLRNLAVDARRLAHPSRCGRGWALGLAVAVLACGSGDPTSGQDTGPAPFDATGSCFVTGTPVATPRGSRAIERLRPGDHVWSYDLTTHSLVERAVLAVHIGGATALHALQFGEGRLDGVTADHPVWNDRDRGWQPAASLQVGASVLRLTDDGRVEAAPLYGHALAAGAGAQSVAVWHLSVEGPDHDYFAGGILVHNKSVDTCTTITDCWGGGSCKNGTITLWKYGSPPVGMFCDQPTEKVCWSGEATCTKGCRKDGLSTIAQHDLAKQASCKIDPGPDCVRKALCEEHRPKKPGDVCQASEDCTPVDLSLAASFLTCNAGSCSK